MKVSMDKKYVTRNGLYDAKVVYIHDKGYHQPVVVFAENKDGGERPIAVWRAHLDGRFSCLHEHEHEHEHKYDLIEVPEVQEDERGDWIKFDAENDEVPFLHMHDMIEVKWRNNYKSSAILAGSVDFNSSRDPVTAYRLVTKAEKPAPTLDDYYRAFDEAWNKGPYREGIKAVLELAGVKL